MSGRPDFSPEMLRFFLRARAEHAVPANATKRQRLDAMRRFKATIRKQAGVTAGQFDLAWMGRLLMADTRVRLWAVLRHFPVDHGVMLNHGGQDHV